MIWKLARPAFYFGLFLVVVLSVIPQDAMPQTGIWDKANHVAAYTALAVAGGIGFRGRRSLMLVAACLFLLGAGLEVVQSFLPDRNASVYDLFANVIGIALGSLLAAGTNRTRFRLRRTNG